jgi:plasmid stabilization system protein ParE
MKSSGWTMRYEISTTSVPTSPSTMRERPSRWVRRIAEAVAMLAWHPMLGRPLGDGDTRRLTISGTPYIAFYRLRESIEILAVLHGARQWPDRFGM